MMSGSLLLYGFGGFFEKTVNNEIFNLNQNSKFVMAAIVNFGSHCITSIGAMNFEGTTIQCF